MQERRPQGCFYFAMSFNNNCWRLYMNALSLKQMGLASILAVAGSFSVAQDADAAGYLKIGDIKGGAIKGGLIPEGVIQIESWSWTGSYDPKSGPCISALVISKAWDRSSDDLIGAFSSGRVFPEAILAVTEPVDGKGEVLFLEMILQDVRIASYAAQSGGGRPSESVALSFAEIEGKNIVFDEKGDTSQEPFLVIPGRCPK